MVCQQDSIVTVDERRNAVRYIISSGLGVGGNQYVACYQYGFCHNRLFISIPMTEKLVADAGWA